MLENNPKGWYFQAPDEAYWPQPQVTASQIEIVSTPAPVSDIEPQPPAPRRRGRPFVKGHDPRRHIFTDEERSRGFYTALAIIGLSIGRKLKASGRWPGYRGR